MNRLKTVLTRVIVVGWGIIAGLLLIEAGLHLIPREDLDAVIEESTRLQLYRLDPRIGWTLRPNAHYVHTTRDNRTIQVKINSLGLRDYEHTYKKPAGVYRILILGDSFAEALDVKMEESFPYLAEQCLNQRLVQSVEVINGGVSGYSTADEYMFYRNEGVKYGSDLVILVLYVGNDFIGLNRTVDERLVAGFGGYRLSLNGSRLSKTWVSWESPDDGQTSSIELFLRRHSLLYRVLAHPESKIYQQYKDWMAGASQWFRPEQDEKDPVIPLDWRSYIHMQDFPNNPIVPQQTKEVWLVFQAIVNQLNNEVKANHGQLAVVIIPANYQVAQNALDQVRERFPALQDEQFGAQWNLDEPNLTIMREMERQVIPALDLGPHFRAHDEAGGATLYFPGFEEHLNRDGQKLMGDIMCDWLSRNHSIHLPRPQ